MNKREIKGSGKKTVYNTSYAKRPKQATNLCTKKTCGEKRFLLHNKATLGPFA